MRVQSKNYAVNNNTNNKNAHIQIMKQIYSTEMISCLVFCKSLKISTILKYLLCNIETDGDRLDANR